MLDWQDVPLRELFAERTGLVVYVGGHSCVVAGRAAVQCGPRARQRAAADRDQVANSIYAGTASIALSVRVAGIGGACTARTSKPAWVSNARYCSAVRS